MSGRSARVTGGYNPAGHRLCSPIAQPPLVGDPLMKAIYCFAMFSAGLGMISSAGTSSARAQTEGAAAIARETHARLAEQQLPVLPPRVVPSPVVTDALVRE